MSELLLLQGPDEALRRAGTPVAPAHGFGLAMTARKYPSSPFHRVTASLLLRVARSPRLPVDFSLPPVPRPLPDNALGSEFTIELRIDALAAVFYIQALTTLLTETGFMFVANPDGFPVRMILASHRFFSPVPFFIRFETGRGLSRT